MPDLLPIALADTATTLHATEAGKVVVCGSHGALYPAALLLAAKVRGSILYDAGGQGQTGLAVQEGLDLLERHGLPGALCSVHASRIGDAADAWTRGMISSCNGLAARLGVQPGMTVRDAAERLTHASWDAAAVPTVAPPRETRCVIGVGELHVVLVDSASLVEPQDAGKIVITGSHGALVGNDPAKALAVDAAAAVFHDAGMGIGQAGIQRLGALARRGIAAVTVAADSAPIGCAKAIWDTGIISAANETARQTGASNGQSLQAWVWQLGDLESRGQAGRR
ncbi:MAG TPA: hypothetical protein VGC69_03695 [Bordetella sp.]